LEVANSIGKRLAEAAIVAKVDGQLTDLSRRIEKDSSLAILTDKNLEAL
jgi:threonyl-tRNA synthetase